MKNQIVGAIAAVVIAVMAVATTGVSAQSQGTTSGITVPIVGSGGGATFAGQVNVQRFVRSGSQILAVGTATGALTNTVPGGGRTVIRQVAIRLDLGGSSALNGVCEILSLVLGPLDLNLLGLQVH